MSAPFADSTAQYEAGIVPAPPFRGSGQTPLSGFMRPCLERQRLDRETLKTG